MAVSRRRSAPVAKTNYDSDEDQIEYLNYNESKYYGYVDDFPSPVQVKRPNPKYKRPSEAVHIAVWDNDPALIQHLVLYKGIKIFAAILKTILCLWILTKTFLDKPFFNIFCFQLANYAGKNVYFMLKEDKSLIWFRG